MTDLSLEMFIGTSNNYVRLAKKEDALIFLIPKMMFFKKPGYTIRNAIQIIKFFKRIILKTKKK